jgi:Carboxypeptidase regulatory-like domain/TonB-dependent Receptor Plug Domain
MSLPLRVYFFLFAIHFAAILAWAAPIGSIKGYVRDPSGAPVPNAILSLTNERTGVVQKTVSDGAGLYQFLDLTPSSYKVAAESKGFHVTDVAGIVVLVDQIVSLDIHLTVGDVTETVQVSSAVGLLQTESPSTGTNVTAQQVANLPLANRQFTDLAVLTPGASFAAPGSQAGAFAAAGTRSQSTNWQIDGVNAIDPNVNGPTNSYRIADAIQELSVQTTAYSAQYGRGSGAQVSVVTKSGSNQFHGGVFEFNRNDILDANNFFTNALNGTKPILRYNQYGGTIGGPIRKDKTFFFYSFEGLQEINPAATTAVVPTAAQRTSITDPIARNLVAFYPLPTLPNAAAGTTNFVGNVPNVTKDRTNLFKIDHNISDKDRLSGRYINYTGNTTSNTSNGALPTTGGNTNTPAQQNAELSETHTFSPTFLSELRLGFSRNKTDIKTQDANVNAASVLPGVPGVVNSTLNPQDAGIPTVSITGGYATLGSPTNYPQGRRSNTYEIYDDSTKILTVGGVTHTVKFGYYGRREETWRFLDGTSRGSVSFANFAQFAGTCATCGGVSQITTSTIHTGDTLGHWYRYPHAFYIQDDIKVKPNLTVNIGLRYELPSVLKEKRDKGTNFVPGVGPVLLGTNEVLGINQALVGPASLTLTPGPVTLSNAGVRPDYTDIGPTIGFAYTPKVGPGFLSDGKTVIRGGFRIGYDDLFNNIPINQTSNAPWSLTTTQRATVTQPGTYSWDLAFNQNVPLVSKTASGGQVGLVTFTGEALNAKQAYAENWNFSIQRQVTNSLSLDVSYIGTSGHRLGVMLDANQPQVVVANPALRGSQAPNQQIFPYPTWGNANLGSFNGSSIYHGLVVSGKWRINSKLTMNTSYTWSHAIDDASSFLGTTFDNQSPSSSNAPLRLQRGNSAFDQRHRFINTFVYQLPFGKGEKFLGDARGVLNQVVGGWSFSGITNITSGQPFTILTSTSVDYSGFNQLVDRPNYTCSGALTINRGDPGNAFGSSCFTPAYANAIGTTPRNAFYGPGLIDFDATFAKRFAISERMGFEFRADFFNLFNHTNFALTSSDRILGNGQFGQLSATAGLSGGNNGGPRVIQLTGRFYF